MKRLLVFFTFSCVSHIAFSQLPADFEKQVDEVCKEWSKPAGPGGVVGVALDGKLVFAKGYGLANLETKTPNNPETVMDVGSVSKQFTAMSILLLEEQGKLKTSDDFTKYIPEVPTFGQTITIDNLLHMTSGLRDYLTLMAGEGWNLVDLRTFQDALDVMSRQTGANDKPGDKWNYCNAGYMMMAIIVERVSGKSLAEFAKENIFKPLGMNDTLYVDNDNLVVPNRAISYAPSPTGGYQFLYSSLAIYGDGGVHTTLADMVKWHENFYHNELGKKDQGLIDKMLTTAKLNNGTDTKYGCGLMSEDFHGHQMWQHGGNWLGFNAMTARIADKHLSVFTFGNDGTNLSSPFNKKIAAIVLGIKDQTEHKEIELSEDKLKAVVGTYELPDHRTATITLEGKQLSEQVTGQPKVPIFPESERRFFLKIVDAQFEFSFDDKGNVTGGAIIQRGVRVPLTKKSEFKPTDAQMNAFVGKFKSFDMEMSIEMAVNNSKLMVKLPDGELEATVLSPDKAVAQGLTLNLMLDSTGVVRGFTLDMGRAIGMRFLKRA